MNRKQIYLKKKKKTEFVWKHKLENNFAPTEHNILISILFFNTRCFCLRIAFLECTYLNIIQAIFFKSFNSLLIRKIISLYKYYLVHLYIPFFLNQLHIFSYSYILVIIVITIKFNIWSYRDTLFQNQVLILQQAFNNK